ncbi:MAG: ABC transporter substrate-binding protein [Spirochaetaceae bacterium]|nr:ABC transporter substrate-binding protein [Spirochaetaceae bacterium]MCF7947144.1 ABC transporter substrate-binding protein [Spirochaetia bacterium]MCF7950009.1 ABC transporter substrate-binding protein [Spirochaetaceae bacterium]
MRLKDITILLAVLVLAGSCGGSEPASESDHQASKEHPSPQKNQKTLVVAEQYGLAYAPLQIMRAQGLLEAELPEYEVEWRRLGNTAAIREAMLAGRLDAGFMGIPPFLIGYDRGMEWRIFTGLSEAPLGLVSGEEGLRSLADFEPDDRIALPQPGSIQHILLSMACERELGQARALDDRLVTMNHPDGMNALLSGRGVSAHFTSPPYLMEELAAKGTHLVVSGREAMGGDFTFIVGVATNSLLQESPEAIGALRRALAQAVYLLENEREQVLELLSSEYGLEQETLSGYLDWEGMKYSQQVAGVERFIEFMRAQDYLESSFSVGQVLAGCVQPQELQANELPESKELPELQVSGQGGTDDD